MFHFQYYSVSTCEGDDDTDDVEDEGGVVILLGSAGGQGEEGEEVGPPWSAALEPGTPPLGCARTGDTSWSPW